VAMRRAANWTPNLSTQTSATGGRDCDAYVHRCATNIRPVQTTKKCTKQCKDARFSAQYVHDMNQYHVCIHVCIMCVA
jgi:hypothetical protein